MNKFLISILLFAFISCKLFKETEKTIDGLSCAVERTKREECGTLSTNQKKCEEKGCCWKIDFLVPWCFKALGSSDLNNSTYEATSKPGESIDEILETKIEEIKKKINEGKTDFKLIEEEIINSFKTTNSKMREKFEEASKIIKDYLNKHYFKSEETKSIHRK